MGEFNTIDLPRFGDVDSGDVRDMNRVLFNGSNVGGVFMTIIGYEVDNEEAFRQQVTEFTDSIILVVKQIWAELTAAGLLSGVLKNQLAKFISAHPIIALIAAAIAVAIIIIVAVWAPADLIIEDEDGITTLNLALLTSASTPLPPVRTYTPPGAIDVTVEPLSKDVEYREKRRYKSGDSTYEIILRYNVF